MTMNNAPDSESKQDSSVISWDHLSKEKIYGRFHKKLAAFAKSPLLRPDDVDKVVDRAIDMLLEEARSGQDFPRQPVEQRLYFHCAHALSQRLKKCGGNGGKENIRDDDEEKISVRIDRVIADYLHRIDKGQPLSQEQLLAQYPELTDELNAFFANEKSVAAKSCDDMPTVKSEAVTKRGLMVRCPNCATKIEVDPEVAIADVKCDSCGSNFNFVGDNKPTQTTLGRGFIGHFQLLRKIGSGGFGTVWLAYDSELDRQVAIKIPIHGILARDEVDKFLREARAAAQLRHPNIVGVHEIGKEGDVIYIVSDLIKGQTLSQWLEKFKPSFRESAKLCIKICDALDHAHQQGVIHRDVKPANIMVDHDNQPHLMDFGLARREMGELTITIDGQVMGTPTFMSPEQARGEAHSADRRSDIYSVGAIFYLLLTGELPFRGNARMVMHQILNDEPAAPRSLNKHIPRDLEVITLKCLEKLPEKRFRSASELSDELKRFLNGRAIQSRAVSPVERAWRWCKRKPAVTALLCMLALVAIVSPIIAFQQFWTIRQAQQDRLARDRILYAASLSWAAKLWSENRPGEAMSKIRQCPEYLRGSEFHLLEGIIQTRAETLYKQEDSIPQLTVLSNGTIISADYGGTINLYDLDLKNVTNTIKEIRNIADISVHPNENSVALLTEDGKIRILGLPGLLDDREEISAFESVEIESAEARFSPNGKYFASYGSVSDDENSDETAQVVKVWDSTNWQVIHALTMPAQSESSDLRFSIDSNSVFLSTDAGSILHWKFLENAQQTSAIVSNESLTCLAVSNDGTKLVSADENGQVFWWNTSDLAQIKMTPQKAHSDSVWSLAFSKDDRLLVSASADRSLKVWNTQTGMEINNIPGGDTSVVCAVIDDAMQHIYFGTQDGSAKSHPVKEPVYCKTFTASNLLWSADTDDNCKFIVATIDPDSVLVWNNHGELLKTLQVEKGALVLEAAISKNGDLIAAVSDDGRLHIWDTRNFDHKFAQTTRGELWNVAISPDGLLIATAGDKVAPSLQIWNRNGNLVASFDRYHQTDIMTVRFNDSGNLVVTGDRDGKVAIWNVKTRKRAYTLESNDADVKCAAFAPGKNVVVVGCDKYRMLYWDFANESCKSIRTTAEYNECIAWAPDGSRFATGGSDNAITFWHPVNLDQLLRLEVHGNYIYSLKFDGDGSRLLSADRNGLIKLWNIH